MLNETCRSCVYVRTNETSTPGVLTCHHVSHPQSSTKMYQLAVEKKTRHLVAWPIVRGRDGCGWYQSQKKSTKEISGSPSLLDKA